MNFGANQHESISALNDMPGDLIFEIISLCDIKTVNRLARCSTRLNHIVNSNENIWRHLSKKYKYVTKDCRQLQQGINQQLSILKYFDDAKTWKDLVMKKFLTAKNRSSGMCTLREVRLQDPRPRWKPHTCFVDPVHNCLLIFPKLPIQTAKFVTFEGKVLHELHFRHEPGSLQFNGHFLILQHTTEILSVFIRPKLSELPLEFSYHLTAGLEILDTRPITCRVLRGNIVLFTCYQVFGDLIFTEIYLVDLVNETGKHIYTVEGRATKLDFDDDFIYIATIPNRSTMTCPFRFANKPMMLMYRLKDLPKLNLIQHRGRKLLFVAKRNVYSESTSHNFYDWRQDLEAENRVRRVEAPLAPDIDSIPVILPHIRSVNGQRGLLAFHEPSPVSMGQEVEFIRMKSIEETAALARLHLEGIGKGKVLVNHKRRAKAFRKTFVYETHPTIVRDIHGLAARHTFVVFSGRSATTYSFGCTLFLTELSSGRCPMKSLICLPFPGDAEYIDYLYVDDSIILMFCASVGQIWIADFSANIRNPKERPLLTLGRRIIQFEPPSISSEPLFEGFSVRHHPTYHLPSDDESLFDA